MNTTPLMNDAGSLLLPDIKCTKCGVTKAFLAFPKNKRCSLGIEKTCRICQKEYKDNWISKNITPTKSYRWKLFPEKHKKYCAAWREKNKAIRRYYTSCYRKSIRQATPSWETKEQLKLFYLGCPIGYHVDHIIPLTNKQVCGLHTVSNLQYLPAVENLRKGNKYLDELRQSDTGDAGRNGCTGY